MLVGDVDLMLDSDVSVFFFISHGVLILRSGLRDAGDANPPPALEPVPTGVL